jgi:hypothetical protein
MPSIPEGDSLIRARTTATALLSLLATALLIVALPSSAGAARNLDVGFTADQFGDNLLTNENSGVRGKWWNRLKQTNSSIVRINVYWNQMVGGNPPVQPRNPNDWSYVFTRTDAAVIEAKRRGLKPVLTVVGAPRWAEGKNPPSDYRVGSWKPNAKMFGQFATAVAKRYSGNWRDHRTGQKLPKVKFYEAWNEPNLPQYLTPQWRGKKAVAPMIYRRMLNEFYKGVKSVRKSNKVVLAGTSPIGDKRGGKRMRPYFFWRETFCLKHNKKMAKKKKCAKPKKKRARFDIFAHNPINAKKGKGPKSKPRHKDDGVPSNCRQLDRIVKKAKKRKTILPNKKKPGWATETWYESKPGEPNAVSPKKQARFMQQALYVLWKQRAKAVFFLQLRDSPYDPNAHRLANFQTGVYTIDEKAKPSLRGVRFPFVADRKTKKQVQVWGIAPKTGKLQITQKGRGKRKVASFRVRKGKVFNKRVKMRKTKGNHKMTAKVKGQKSLVWNQK